MCDPDFVTFPKLEGGPSKPQEHYRAASHGEIEVAEEVADDSPDVDLMKRKYQTTDVGIIFLLFRRLEERKKRNCN